MDSLQYTDPEMHAAVQELSALMTEIGTTAYRASIAQMRKSGVSPLAQDEIAMDVAKEMLAHFATQYAYQTGRHTK